MAATDRADTLTTAILAAPARLQVEEQRRIVHCQFFPLVSFGNWQASEILEGCCRHHVAVYGRRETVNY
jgi:hypothetical protein